MAGAEADLDAFVARTCQHADPYSGITPRSYPRSVWAQLHQTEQKRQAAGWAGSAVGQLQREVARLRRELAELRRDNQRLRIETLGGTIKQARAAGYRAPPGAKDGAPVAGLPKLLLDTMAEALGMVRGELEERLTALEKRPVLTYRDLWREGTSYAAGDSVSWSGSLWAARADGLLERPSLDSDSWRLVVKRGRDGRDGKDLTK